MPLSVVFMGTPDFSVPSLAEVVAAGHAVRAVYTQPPRPAGRGMVERKSPVHLFAEASGLEVRVPASLRDIHVQQAFAALQADVAVVVAYGLILPSPVLAAPAHGCLNLHASKLPRWRGAAPIQRAIMAGDVETAAMVMRMEAGLDTGPVCLAETVPIGLEMTAGELHDELSQVGAGLLVRALAALERGSLACSPQPSDGITYARKIEKAETRIDFGRLAHEVHDHIRGLSPAPGAWTELPIGPNRERVKVIRSRIIEGGGAPGTTLDRELTIACGSGAVRLLELQPAGKRVMSAAEFLRGTPIGPGVVVGR